jgi:chromatin remodeling complex protein RSC6
MATQKTTPKKTVKSTPKKKEVKKEEVKKVEEPVVQEPETPVVESTVESSDEKKDPIVESINGLLGKFETMEKESRNAKNELRKVLKSYQKKAFKSKKRKSDPNRTPSGFAKPALISPELCKFLGKDKGSLMARTDVTKEVNKYIKAHNLQNPANKKEIKPDPTLCNLLNIKKDDNLTYFSLQKFLKNHFPKSDSSVSA